nr:MAG TPA: hypothetical protein [Caudoviricetes sp.]
MFRGSKLVFTNSLHKSWLLRIFLAILIKILPCSCPYLTLESNYITTI